MGHFILILHNMILFNNLGKNDRQPTMVLCRIILFNKLGKNDGLIFIYHIEYS